MCIEDSYWLVAVVAASAPQRRPATDAQRSLYPADRFRTQFRLIIYTHAASASQVNSLTLIDSGRV